MTDFKKKLEDKSTFRKENKEITEDTFFKKDRNIDNEIEKRTYSISTDLIKFLELNKVLVGNDMSETIRKALYFYIDNNSEAKEVYNKIDLIK